MSTEHLSGENGQPPPKAPETTAVPPTASEHGSDDEETIKLDQFLKLADLVGSGGEAKHLIRTGVVLVNGAAETRRGRKLRHGDIVNVHGEDYVIEATTD